MSWQVEWSREAVKDLRRLDRRTKERLLEAVERLAETGHGDLIRLQPPLDGYRLRMGDWRIFLHLNSVERTIEVRQVRPRGGAY